MSRQQSIEIDHAQRGHAKRCADRSADTPTASKRATRILMLLENDSYPDDTRVVLEAETLHKAGYNVTVICPTGQSKQKVELVEGVRVYRYPQPWQVRGFVGYVLEYSYSMLAAGIISFYVLLRHGFDVVHIHAPPDMNGLIGAFYKLLRKQIVLDQHDLSPELYQVQKAGQGSQMVHRALLWFERFACRWADRVIVTNQTQRDVQIERSGVRPSHCHVVRNGPGARFLAPTEPLDVLANSGKTIIGYVGMIGIQDGLDCLMRTLAHLRDDFGHDAFLAVIVGSGPALADIKRMADKLKLQNCVQFAGYVSGQALLRHIASFDICVTPDPSNPYNDSCTTIKTMEYMAMGKPTVAFDLPENRFTAGDSALYATNNDEMELAAKIAQLMDDPTTCAEMGQLGRRRIEQHFTWERQAEHLLDVYRKLTTGQAAANGSGEPVELPAAELAARKAATVAR